MTHSQKTGYLGYLHTGMGGFLQVQEAAANAGSHSAFLQARAQDIAKSVEALIHWCSQVVVCTFRKAYGKMRTTAWQHQCTVHQVL